MRDQQWLPIVGQLGWPVIMRDKRIRRRIREKAALVDAGVQAFVLTGSGQSTTWDQVLLLAELGGDRTSGARDGGSVPVRPDLRRVAQDRTVILICAGAGAQRVSGARSVGLWILFSSVPAGCGRADPEVKVERPQRSEDQSVLSVLARRLGPTQGTRSRPARPDAPHSRRAPTPRPRTASRCSPPRRNRPHHTAASHSPNTSRVAGPPARPTGGPSDVTILEPPGVPAPVIFLQPDGIGVWAPPCVRGSLTAVLTAFSQVSGGGRESNPPDDPRPSHRC